MNKDKLCEFFKNFGILLGFMTVIAIFAHLLLTALVYLSISFGPIVLFIFIGIIVAAFFALLKTYT